MTGEGSGIAYLTRADIGACAIAHPGVDMAEAAQELIDTFEAVELQFDYDAFNLPPGPTLIHDLQSLRERHGIKYVVHLPLSVALASPNPAIRRASVETLEQVIELCLPLQPHAYVLHVEPLSDVDPRSVGLSAELSIAGRDQALRSAERSLVDLLSQSTISCREIAVETMLYPFELLDDILERLDLSVCCDTGHLMLEGRDPAAFVRRYARRLRHVHLHDVVNGFDHQPLGDADGMLVLGDFWRALSDVQYGGIVTLEMMKKEDVKQSLDVVLPYVGVAER